MAPELCPLCKRPSDCQLCGMACHKGPCWCANVAIPGELLARVPMELRNKACICRRCIGEHSQHGRENAHENVLGRDFYFDKEGLMVFTAEYHLRRGYCCGSGCRHCPYPAAK